MGFVRVRVGLVLVGGLLACGSQGRPAVQAQGNLRERGANAAERADNRRDLRRDQADFAAIVTIRDAWRRAVDQGDRAAERAADARLAAWLRRELRDSRRDLGEARRETARSAGERNRSRREARRSGTRDDRRDLRDDRRDVRDDRRDQRQARSDLAQTRAVAVRLRDMQPAFAAGTAEPPQYAHKGALLDQLARMAAREVREDREEIREDRRERREDRRERREDRRR